MMFQVISLFSVFGKIPYVGLSFQTVRAQNFSSSTFCLPHEWPELSGLADWWLLVTLNPWVKRKDPIKYCELITYSLFSHKSWLYEGPLQYLARIEALCDGPTSESQCSNSKNYSNLCFSRTPCQQTHILTTSCNFQLKEFGDSWEIVKAKAQTRQDRAEGE